MASRSTTVVVAVVLAVLVLMTFGAAIQAQPSADRVPQFKTPAGKTTFELRPAAGSDYVFDKVKVTRQKDVLKLDEATARRKDADKLNDGILVEAEDKGSLNSGPTGYYLEIDLKQRTYNAVKMPESELREAIEESAESLGLTRQPTSTDTVGTASTDFIRVVVMITRDPPGYKLTESRHALRWTYGPRFVARGKYARGYRTPPGTRWYVSYNRFRGLRYIDGGRTLESKHDAAFYNYNWGDPSLATIVRHRSTIEGYRRGGWRYYWRWNAAGESYRLLTPQVYSYGGSG